jgi:predicted nucleic acid-binding protein
VILVDSNIPMYLVGAPHPHKPDAQRLLERAIADGERLVTDAEVLQEILHRYVAIDRRDAIQPAFDALLGVVDEVFPMDPADVERAKSIVLGSRRPSARDAIHLAVMERRHVGRIMSFDSGFDGFPGIARMGL